MQWLSVVLVLVLVLVLEQKWGCCCDPAWAREYGVRNLFKKGVSA